jgi:archaeal type IV pilus assembly protein PilA
VILAAVIAAFVFGMAGNIQKTKVISVTTQRTSETQIIATYQGGSDSAMLKNVQFTVDNVDNSLLGSKIGSSVVIGVTATRVHLVGVATFSDGAQQVVVDTTV